MHKEIIENQWSKYQCQEVRKMEGSRKKTIKIKIHASCACIHIEKENQQWQKLVTGKD